MEGNCMKDIPLKRILRYTIAAFLVMILTAYGFGVGIASATEVFNQTHQFSFMANDNTVVNTNFASTTTQSASGTLGTIQQVTINFNQIKVLNEFKAPVSNNTGQACGLSFKAAASGIVTKLVPMTAYISGQLYGNGSIGWQRNPPSTTNSEFNYYIIFDSVDTIFANSLTGTQTMTFVYDTSVFTSYINAPAYPSGCTGLNSISSYSDLYMNIIVGTNNVGNQIAYSVTGGTYNVQYSNTATILLSVNQISSNFAYVNLTRNSNNILFQTMDINNNIIYQNTATSYESQYTDIRNGLKVNNEFVAQLQWWNNSIFDIGGIPFVIPTPGSIPTTTISLNKTIIQQNAAFNYTIGLSNADTNSNYYLALMTGNDILGYIDFGSSSSIVGTRSYNVGSLAAGVYHLTLYATGYGALSTRSENFTVVVPFSTDFDNIHTTKSIYNASESQLIYGYATSPAQIKIYAGATLVTGGNKGTYTGIFNITANQGTGSYIVTMERNVGGHISIVTSVNYVVSNDNTIPISIFMVDPGTFDCGSCFAHNTIDRRFAIGNTVSGGDGGQMITVNYNRKNNNDTVYIYNPQGTIFDSWTVNTYSTWLTSREFYVPNEYSSIGVWTAKIVDSTNASNFSTSILTAFVYDNYVNNADSVGNAIIQTTSNNPCAGTSIGVSWSVTNMSVYAVRIYREGDNTLLFNDTYTSSTGSIIVTLNSASSTYYFKIMNSTTFQTINQISINTKSQSECAAANANATVTPQTGNWTATQTDVTSPCRFWDGWVGFMGMGINDISRFQFALLIIGLITVISVAATKNIGIGVTMGFFPYAFFLYLSLSTSCGTYIPTWTAVFIALIIGIKLRWFS